MVNGEDMKVTAHDDFGSNSAAIPNVYQDAFYSKDLLAPVPVITKAEGIYMYDADGIAYIDASSGPIVSNIGHANRRVADAMHGQALELDYAYSRVARHQRNAELTSRIAALAGPGFERVALTSGGSEAMDFALKFLRQYVVATGIASRRHIISNMPSYHGATIATLGISGDESLAPFLDGFAITSPKIPAPLAYRRPAGVTIDAHALMCANALDAEIQRLGPRNVLAFVIEPIGGVATGCLVPPDSYFEAIREICTRHGIFLVFDEILCGAGRTGAFMAAHHWPKSLPDVVVMAKGLAAGYSPLGAVLLPAAMVDELAALTGFNFSHTYNANPISCAAGLAVLDEYDRHNLMGNARQIGARLGAGLGALGERSPVVGDVRGMGLLYAVELVADKTSKTPFPAEFQVTEVARIEALKNGLMIYSRRTSRGRYGDWFIVAPPLTITEGQCDEILQRISRAVGGIATQFQAFAANANA